jgi:hypothetical protein
MRIRTLLPILALFCVSLDGCKGSCSLEATNYDQSCKADSDCVAVFSGSFCGAHTCACENAAINVSSESRYSADFNNEGAPRCPCPAAPAVACNQGTCGLRGATSEAGAD